MIRKQVQRFEIGTIIEINQLRWVIRSRAFVRAQQSIRDIVKGYVQRELEEYNEEDNQRRLNVRWIE